MAALLLSSCNNSSPKMDDKPVQGSATATDGMRIAYVEVDSLMSQYEFCKEYMAVLQKKSNNARNTITQKGKQLQAAAANFQQKLQNAIKAVGDEKGYTYIIDPAALLYTGNAAVDATPFVRTKLGL